VLAAEDTVEDEEEDEEEEDGAVKLVVLSEGIMLW
jgi:hypothetical protein